MANVILGVGGTDGSTVAIGSPSNFTSINSGSGTIKYDVDRTIGGVIGIEVVSAASAATSARYTDAGSSADMAINTWFWGPGTTQSEDVTLWTGRSSGGVNVRLQWSTTNSLYIQPTSGSNITIASGLDPAQAYQVKLLVHNGTTTTGTLTAKVYNTSNTQIGSTVTGSAMNLGTAAFVGGDWGVTGALTAPHVVGFAIAQVNVGGTTDIANYTTSSPAATVRPVAVAANTGAWTIFGGSPDGATATSDSNDTTGIQSPTSPGSPADIDLTLADALVLGSGGTVYVKCQLVGSGGTYNAYLVKGSTVMKTWTLTPTSTLTEYALSFNSTEAAAVGTNLSDWAGLKVRLRAA